jgi:hypothetical protein
MMYTFDKNNNDVESDDVCEGPPTRGWQRKQYTDAFLQFYEQRKELESKSENEKIQPTFEIKMKKLQAREQSLRIEHRQKLESQCEYMKDRKHFVKGDDIPRQKLREKVREQIRLRARRVLTAESDRRSNTEFEKLRSLIFQLTSIVEKKTDDDDDENNDKVDEDEDDGEDEGKEQEDAGSSSPSSSSCSSSSSSSSSLAHTAWQYNGHSGSMGDCPQDGGCDLCLAPCIRAGCDNNSDEHGAARLQVI